MEQMKEAMQLQFNELDHQQSLQHSDEAHDLEMGQKRDQGELELRFSRQKLNANGAK